jgi:hypothetical protein
MRYLPNYITRRSTTERRITCGFRPSPRRHAHARVGSFRYRGHGGRKGCLLPPTLSSFLSPWLLRPWIWLWLPPPIWIWASLALLREAGTPILIRGFNRSRWRPRPGRFPAPGPARWLRETRLASDCTSWISLCGNVLKETHSQRTAGRGSPN